jgi:hypothetical protein
MLTKLAFSTEADGTPLKRPAAAAVVGTRATPSGLCVGEHLVHGARMRAPGPRGSVHAVWDFARRARSTHGVAWRVHCLRWRCVARARAPRAAVLGGAASHARPGASARGDTLRRSAHLP